MTPEVMDPPRGGTDGAVPTVLGCVELLVTGTGLTLLGQAFLVVQALFVGVLAELEWIGLRRAPAAAWA